MGVYERELLDEWGSVLGVAKAYIEGKINIRQWAVRDICDVVDIAAAEAVIRLEREAQ